MIQLAKPLNTKMQLASCYMSETDELKAWRAYDYLYGSGGAAANPSPTTGTLEAAWAKAFLLGAVGAAASAGTLAVLNAIFGFIG